MNLFKGLLYLIDNDTPGSPGLLETRHYGAATAANEFARELGNQAASHRRFGVRSNDRESVQDVQIAAACGCR